MSEELNHDRRRFLAAGALAAAPVPFGVIGCAGRRATGAPGQLPLEGELPSLGGASDRVFLMITDNEGETVETETFVQVNESQPAEIHISGAGFIMPGGQKADFAFEAAKEGPSYSGNLTYHDRDPNLKVRSLAVTSVQRFGNRAVFSGTRTLNKQPGYTFTVTVEDGGSGSSDTFRINLSNGYEASGTLAGGNIQFN